MIATRLACLNCMCKDKDANNSSEKITSFRTKLKKLLKMIFFMILNETLRDLKNHFVIDFHRKNQYRGSEYIKISTHFITSETKNMQKPGAKFYWKLENWSLYTCS
jgi:spore coat polysaccharide biosynthesis predicted glycosyltransferase SpsG